MNAVHFAPESAAFIIQWHEPCVGSARREWAPFMIHDLTPWLRLVQRAIGTGILQDGSPEVAMAKYGKAASGKNVESTMRRKKKGTLKSSSGRKVTSRKQAIAIALTKRGGKGREGAAAQVRAEELAQDVAQDEQEKVAVNALNRRLSA